MDSLADTGIAGAHPGLGSGPHHEYAMREGILETRTAAEMADLNDLREAGHLSSTGFALADEGKEDLFAYNPHGGEAVIDLRGAPDTLRGTFFQVGTGQTEDAGDILADEVALAPSFDGAWGLVLTTQDELL
jgi:hypothetical protein